MPFWFPAKLSVLFQLLLALDFFLMKVSQLVSHVLEEVLHFLHHTREVSESRHHATLHAFALPLIQLRNRLVIVHIFPKASLKCPKYSAENGATEEPLSHPFNRLAFLQSLGCRFKMLVLAHRLPLELFYEILSLLFLGKEMNL
jgi:hypothetical protein